MQTGPGLSRVPGAELEASQAMPNPDEDQVALANLDVLVSFGGGQIGGGDLISRLEPGDAACPGTSSSTPRPTMPSAAAAIDSSAAPVSLTMSAGRLL
jgi:hypothetical protein